MLFRLEKLSKLIYAFSTNPIRIPGVFCFVLFFKKLIGFPKIYMECKELRVANTILIKRRKVRGFTFIDFKAYYKSTVIKSRYCHKALWNSIEKLKIKPYSYSQLIFNKDIKTTQLEKEESFKKSWWNVKWISSLKGKKFDPYHILHTKTISKW